MTCGQVWWPHTQNLCSAFNPSKCTHIAVNTHTVNHTPGAVGSLLCCGAWGAVGGSVPCSRFLPQSWYRVVESAGCSLQNQNGLIIETGLDFWVIKRRCNFYHCRVVVSTHCKDTFICKLRYFASNVSFKIKNIIILIQVMKALESLTVISVKHYCKFKTLLLYMFEKWINSWTLRHFEK